MSRLIVAKASARALAPIRALMFSFLCNAGIADERAILKESALFAGTPGRMKAATTLPTSTAT